MARIPGVPTLDPVSQPTMNPAQAGRVGAAVAGLGEVAEDAAYQQQGLNLFMKKAQQNVDEITFQNQAHAQVLNYQEALAKATNSRDIEDITQQHLDGMNELVKTWQKSPALIQIQQQADGLKPQMEHLGIVKTADLQVKESAVQTGIQMQTLLPQLVGAQRNGDKGQVDYINGYIDHIYDERLKSGLISQAEADKEKNAIQIQFRQQLNDAAISSFDPKERQAAIAQLEDPTKSGPLNLAGLAPGDIAALRTHAESTDRTLTNLYEARTKNAVLNNWNNIKKSSPELQTLSAQEGVLHDGEWLVNHNIQTPDGKPDWVMAEMLEQEAVREESVRKKIQNDRDEEISAPYAERVALGTISRAELAQIPDEAHGGISTAAKARLEGQWRANTNENIRLQNESYTVQRQIREDKSREATGNWVLRIGSGEMPDNVTIQTTPGLSKADAAYVMSTRDKAKADGPYQEGLSVLRSAWPEAGKAGTPQAKAHEAYLAAHQAYDQAIQEHPQADKTELAQKIVMPGIVRSAIESRVNSLYPKPPGLFDRLSNFVHGTPAATPSSSPATVTQSFQGKDVPGLVKPGNLDITQRPNIDNKDGTHSTTYSMSFGTENGEVLVPGVGDGSTYPARKLTTKEALDQYHKTGNNFGTFKTAKDADAYAQKLHEDQSKFGNDGKSGTIRVKEKSSGRTGSIPASEFDDKLYEKVK